MADIWLFLIVCLLLYIGIRLDGIQKTLRAILDALSKRP